MSEGNGASVWMNKTKLAKMLDLTRPTLDKHLGRPGCPAPNEARLYDAIAVARFVTQRQSSDNNVGSAAVEAAKLAGLTLDNEKKELDNKKARGEVVDKREAVAWITEQFGSLRHRLMSIPPMTARAIHGKNVAQVEKLLADIIADILNQFADVHLEKSGLAPTKVKPSKKKQPTGKGKSTKSKSAAKKTLKHKRVVKKGSKS